MVMRDNRRIGVWIIGVSSDERIELYWRSDAIGSGPALSYHVAGRELLRFDLVYPPHKHDARERDAPRHYYPEGLSIEEYVELVISDLAVAAPAAGAAASAVRDGIISRCKIGRPAFEP